MKKETSAVKGNHEDTDVVFMNEKIHSSQSRDGSISGIFLILGGILLLLNTFGIIPWGIWDVLLRFWPVLIIIAGVQIILGGSRIARILTNIVTLALVAWVVLISLQEVSPEFIEKLPDIFKQPIEWWEVISR